MNKKSAYFVSGLMISLTVILLISACGAGPTGGTASPADGDGGPSRELQTSLTEQVGEPMENGVTFEQYVEIRDSGQTFEYDQPSIDGLGCDTIGYGYTTGETLPGEPVMFYVYPCDQHSVVVEKEFRFTLTARDAVGERAAVITEETVYVDVVDSHMEVFQTVIPDERAALYLFAAEMLDDDGTVIDTVLNWVYVPAAYARATIEIDKMTYTSDETLLLTIKNEGQTRLFLGRPYEIEREVNGEWQPVELDLAFTMEAILPAPGESFEQEVSLENLEPGIYRVIKNVGVEGMLDYPGMRLAAEFEIVD